MNCRVLRLSVSCGVGCVSVRSNETLQRRKEEEDEWEHRGGLRGQHRMERAPSSLLCFLRHCRRNGWRFVGFWRWIRIGSSASWDWSRTPGNSHTSLLNVTVYRTVSDPDRLRPKRYLITVLSFSVRKKKWKWLFLSFYDLFILIINKGMVLE